MTIEERLHQKMLGLYTQAGKETGYWGNYYLRSVKRHGGLATARRMLIPKKNHKIDKGLQALIDAGRADELSVEAIVLLPEYRSLFTDAEITEAARRIGQLPDNTKRVSVPPESNFPDTLPESETYAEGAIRRVIINAFERDPKAREACLKKYGRKCAICSIDFEAIYGDIGKDFIHVHHKKPLAAIRSEYLVNPRLDLVPVCPNCHAMLHTSNPPLAIEALREIYESRNKGQ